ncbi:MAG: hypothetical protein ACLTPG_04905 [Mediterraneibacter gnavus]
MDGKGGYEVSSCIVTEELEEALAPTKEFLRLKTGRQKEDGVFARAYEKAPQQMVDLAERIKSRLPKELPQTGNKGITLQAVAENIKNGSSVEEELDAFVAQFTNEELAVIVRGEGMSSPKRNTGYSIRIWRCQRQPGMVMASRLPAHPMARPASVWRAD